LNEAGYKFHQSGNSFEFFTAYGAAYAVSFVMAGEYFGKHPVADSIYRIDVEQNDPGPYNNLDIQVGITIAEIVLFFFERNKNGIIFYLCDPADGKDRARERKFEYWYRLFGNSDYNRIVVSVSTNNIAAKIYFVFLKNNPFAYDLPAIIEKAKNSFGDK